VNDLPLIVVEVVMIFGGAVAFGWWQLRDLRREREKRERRQRGEASSAAVATPTRGRDEA
jgi:hypothetical protein